MEWNKKKFCDFCDFRVKLKKEGTWREKRKNSVIYLRLILS